jgi:hypothetical protein
MSTSSSTTDFSSKAHHTKIVNNYIALWKGDLSLLNDTFHSGPITFNADRFPSSSGTGSEKLSITSREAFAGFVQGAGQGFEKYGFEPYYWLGEGNKIAIRWYLDGVVGDFNRFPTSLKKGDKVTYDGTDCLILNKETGLIERVDCAQDLLTLFHAMGLPGISI